MGVKFWRVQVVVVVFCSSLISLLSPWIIVPRNSSVIFLSKRKYLVLTTNLRVAAIFALYNNNTNNLTPGHSLIHCCNVSLNLLRHAV